MFRGTFATLLVCYTTKVAEAELSCACADQLMHNLYIWLIVGGASNLCYQANCCEAQEEPCVEKISTVIAVFFLSCLLIGMYVARLVSDLCKHESNLSSIRYLCIDECKAWILSVCYLFCVRMNVRLPMTARSVCMSVPTNWSITIRGWACPTTTCWCNWRQSFSNSLTNPWI